MPTTLVTKLSVLALFIGLTASAQTRPQPASVEYPTPSIREEQTVVVNGVSEVWRLQWKSAPTPYCEAEDEGSQTCPCNGFAYGEGGDLYLVRLREGAEVERLRLTDLFSETSDEQAAVQRWPQHDDDFEPSRSPDFAATVRERPIVQVMHFGDYDHDGSATEFFLQTGSGPCGHVSGVVVGVSKANPRLHVFGTASNPKKPLTLEPHEWKKLKNASSKPLDLTHIQCGDHGAETETDVRLTWSAEGIDGTWLEYTCAYARQRRRLIRQWPLSSDQ